MKDEDRSIRPRIVDVDEGGAYRNIHDDRRYVAVLPSRKNAEMESLSVSEERVVLERRNIALALWRTQVVSERHDVRGVRCSSYL
jgi:hypothetical protein